MRGERRSREAAPHEAAECAAPRAEAHLLTEPPIEFSPKCLADVVPHQHKAVERLGRDVLEGDLREREPLLGGERGRALAPLEVSLRAVRRRQLQFAPLGRRVADRPEGRRKLRVRLEACPESAALVAVGARSHLPVMKPLASTSHPSTATPDSA